MLARDKDTKQMHLVVANFLNPNSCQSTLTPLAGWPQIRDISPKLNRPWDLKVGIIVNKDGWF